MPEVKAAKPDHQDRTEVLMAILQEQRQTNQLLLMLIEAMGEDDSDTDAEPRAYMDGSPV